MGESLHYQLVTAYNINVNINLSFDGEKILHDHEKCVQNENFDIKLIILIESNNF